MDRRRKQFDEHVTRMNAERLVKIPRDNMPAGTSSELPKTRWSLLIRDLKDEINYTNKKIKA